MSSHNKLLGKRGEEKARQFLQQSGYTIVAKNYRCRQGEIDIIARIDNTLVFIEVKTRSGIEYGTPGEAVDYRKQAKYRSVAQSFIQRYGYYDMDYRFDIIEIYAYKDFQLNHIINAF